MTSGDLVTGKIGKAIDFDGTNDLLTGADSSTLEIDEVTLQIWARFTSLGTLANIFGRSGGGSSPYKFRSNSTDINFQVHTTAAANINSPNLALTTDYVKDSSTWYMLHGTYKSTDKVRIYKNGVEKSTGTAPGASLKITSTEGLEMADSQADGGNGWFGGLLDEARIKRYKCSDNWILTEYNNQSNTDTFYTVGSEETLISNKDPILCFW